MQRKIIEWIEVLFSEYKMQENAQLKNFLASSIFKNFLKKLKKWVLVVGGWDGSMLEAIAWEYQRKLPFLGINFGHKWFLLNDVSILKGDTQFQKRQYPLLECIVKGKKGIAFNEFDIKAGDGKMLDLDICVMQGHILNVLGDGLIISTPTGSTWYNSSLGWPILPHGLNTFVVTPKAPWKPRGLSPIIMKNNQVMKITTKGRLTPVEIYVDGREFLKLNEKDIEIKIKQSRQSVTLLISREHLSYWDNKVLEEQGFKLHT